MAFGGFRGTANLINAAPTELAEPRGRMWR